MNRIATFQIPLRVEELRPSSFAGALATPLAEPMQALVTAISRRAAEASFSIYLCADDDTTRTRDDFAIALARSLAAHIPSTLVVDCDFLRPGLSGLVPQKDALGFLDYMLYGSSIGVITQDDDRVHLVGAGSFPVTKRMPFVESAFDDAARRLVAHARCVIFVGPAFDGAGGRHPLTTVADVVATVRTTPRHPRLDSAEETISGGGPDVWSIRLADAADIAPHVAPAPPSSAPQPPRRAEPPAEPSLAPPRSVPPPRRGATAPAAPPPPPDLEMRKPASLAPRVAVIVFGLLVIAFVGWWFMQNRELPGFGSEEGSPVATADSARPPVDTVAARDTTAAEPARPETTSVVPPKPQAPQPTPDTSQNPTGATGGGELVSSEDVQLMEDLVRRFNGWFIIHISSFQTSARAREEVAFIEGREFPAFIVFLDLGAKGKWYRVYSGPFATREEATEVKKNLDAIPQVRFTRIASIPD